jgi:hypothetical protein
VSRTSAIALVPEAPVDKGRLLSIDDVIALFPRRPDGRPSRARWWVTHEFCPEGKIKLGRSCYWYESEAHAWINAQRVPV